MKKKLEFHAVKAHNWSRRFLASAEKGQGLTEYALLAVGIVLLVIVALSIFTDAGRQMWQRLADLMTS